MEKRETLCTVDGAIIGAGTLEDIMDILQKLGIDLPYDPAIPLSGIYLRNMKTLI